MRREADPAESLTFVIKPCYDGILQLTAAQKPPLSAEGPQLLGGTWLGDNVAVLATDCDAGAGT